MFTPKFTLHGIGHDVWVAHRVVGANIITPMCSWYLAHHTACLWGAGSQYDQASSRQLYTGVVPHDVLVEGTLERDTLVCFAICSRAKANRALLKLWSVEMTFEWNGSQPTPAVLEIPSKDQPYDASKDSILARCHFGSPTVPVLPVLFTSRATSQNLCRCLATSPSFQCCCQGSNTVASGGLVCRVKFMTGEA